MSVISMLQKSMLFQHLALYMQSIALNFITINSVIFEFFRFVKLAYGFISTYKLPLAHTLIFFSWLLEKNKQCLKNV